MIHETIAHLAVPVAELRPYERNPRRGAVAVIAESLRVNGQYRPVVARRGTGEVLAGNHTFLAARDELGWDQIAVTWVDVDDEVAARIVAADNRTADLAGYDPELLADLLGGLPDLAGTGYTADAVEQILAQAATPDLEDFPAFDESQADKVKMLTCPACGHEFPA